MNKNLRKTREIDRVLRLLKSERGLDFSGSSRSVIEKGFEQRLRKTNIGSYLEYYDFIRENPEEHDRLVQTLTINVSCFFRDPLVFDYLTEFIFPEITNEKAKKGDLEVRIWSAGCASGEEPYSVAIVLKELADSINGGFHYYVFGTDIDLATLLVAKNAVFSKQSIENIRYGYVKYFSQRGDKFTLGEEVRNIVSFSRHDLLDRKNMAPPECVFADFDIVLCRNVLIYFTPQLQETALSKIYRSLNRGGYLVLGESEVLPKKYQNYFEKVCGCCHIYRKIK